MVVTKDSPNRRRSIAVASHSKPSAVPRRRRAHSVILRTSLSPQAKARRLLVPRKSILKASFTAEDLEDNEITESMDLTQDFRARIHDNASRKSFSRRVSFAEHAHVRVFQIPEKDHTTSTASPHSSPSSASSEPDVEPAPQNNDENDYPNANKFRRRSSIRYSTGSDMDLTTIGGSNFMGNGADIDSAILDEDFDDTDDMEMSDDMDVTQAVNGNIRRRSSVAPGRRNTLPPSAILQMDEDENVGDVSQSSIAEDSLISETPEEDESQRVEFTVPMGRSLRPPAHEDEVWLALRQATHSGNTPIEPQEESFDEGFEPAPNQGGMPLGDALQRLLRARESLGHHEATTNDPIESQDDTMSSIDSIDNDDNGNKTLNLSRVIGRFSLGTDANSRMSMGHGETSMDESEVYGNIAGGSASRQSIVPSTAQELTSQELVRPSVFHPPPPSNPPATSSVQQPTTSMFSQPPASSSAPRLSVTTSSSPSKGKAKPTFTAAFAPPVSKPSPKKVPSKRVHSDAENIDSGEPSPAKRQALGSKLTHGTDGSQPDSTATSTTTPRPQPLSPSKKAMFQSPGQPSQAAPRPQSSLRQPAGYMARRKSLATGLASQANATQSPARRRALTAGRVSLGSGPHDAWKRFDKTAPFLKATVSSQQRNPEPQEHIDEEVTPAQPSPIRHSPSPRNAHVDGAAEPMDLSVALNAPTFGNANEELSPLDKAERWRAGVEEGDYEDDDVPAISIGHFFEMTGIKFMDEIAAPRRSIHPGQQPSRRPRPAQEIGLSEYAVAMTIDIPQLELYTRVSRDLEAWMGKSKDAFLEAEEEAAKVTPELFVEYSRADEEGQAELLHQLNFIKTNARGSAKSDWYDWKLKWVEGLKITADQAFADLESDAKKLEVLSATASDLIPDLEKEYAEIVAELEREQQEVSEIEASDQDYLNELKASIAEQNIEVEALKAEVVENKDQLTWLNERLRETEQQKQEVSSSIAKAERVLQIQKSSTRTEVFQLKDELEALEDLHLTRITRVDAQLFEYIYSSTYNISIPCTNFSPIVSKISITRLEHARALQKDDFPKLTNLFVACAAEILDEEHDRTVRQVVHKLGDYWTSCSQLRSHLRLLAIKYPVDVEIAPPSSKTPTPTFKARATVMFPKLMGKAIVSFVFNLQTFSEWPLSIDSLDCEVDVGYGALDRSAILKAVVNRLAQATPSDNYALLDSCIDAQALYN